MYIHYLSMFTLCNRNFKDNIAYKYIVQEFKQFTTAIKCIHLIYQELYFLISGLPHFKCMLHIK